MPESADLGFQRASLIHGALDKQRIFHIGAHRAAGFVFRKRSVRYPIGRLHLNLGIDILGRL